MKMKLEVKAEKKTDMIPWNWTYSLSLVHCIACKQYVLWLHQIENTITQTSGENNLLSKKKTRSVLDSLDYPSVAPETHENQCLNARSTHAFFHYSKTPSPLGMCSH